MVKLSHFETNILNNNLTHLVPLRPSTAARTMMKTNEGSQMRAIIVVFFFVCSPFVVRGLKVSR